MVQFWTNPFGLCLFLHLFAGFQSQIQFKTKFKSAPITEPKKISSSTLSFVDQASQFRSVFFQKRKPKLFKSAKFPFGAEASPATEDIPALVTEREEEVSDEASADATTTVRDDEEVKFSNVERTESTTELFLDGDLQGASSVVKVLFQRPKSSLLASSRGKNRKASFFRSGDHPRSDLSKSSFLESKRASSFNRSSESPNKALPSSSVVENTRPTIGLMKLDKVIQTGEVLKFSNDEVTTTEGSIKESFNLSRSTPEVKAKPQKSSLLAFSGGKTVTVTTASSLRRTSETPSITTPVQGVSNSVEEEEEDFILEMMAEVFLDSLKQDIG